MHPPHLQTKVFSHVFIA